MKKCGSEELKKLLKKSSVMLEIRVGNISQKGCLTKKRGGEKIEDLKLVVMSFQGSRFANSLSNIPSTSTAVDIAPEVILRSY